MHILVVFSSGKALKLCVCLDADIGADVLDLAETMVASDGLIYEAVSYDLLQWSNSMFLYCVIKI